MKKVKIISNDLLFKEVDSNSIITSDNKVTAGRSKDLRNSVNSM